MEFAVAFALVLSVVDYFAWTATVDDPVWGTVTSVLDWVFVLAFVVFAVLLVRKITRHSPR